jgi:hypothetical protein
VACAAVGATFPEHRAVRPAQRESGRRPYAAVLRAGVAEVRSQPALRAALLLVPAVTALWGVLDEYAPLLAAGTGVADETVPLLFLLVYAGVAAGGLLAGRAGRLSRRGLGAVLAAAAGALALGALSGTPSGFVLLAAAFGAFQAVTVVVDARLQHAITGSARATVTSVASLATELLVLAAFAAYGAGSQVAGHSTLFALFAGVYAIVAAALWRRPHSAAAGIAVQPAER